MRNDGPSLSLEQVRVLLRRRSIELGEAVPILEEEVAWLEEAIGWSA